MADIPVTKKNSMWWLWLLLLLIVGALIWWFVEANEKTDVETAAVAPVAAQVATDQTATTAPVADTAMNDHTNDLAMLTSAQIAGMVGHEVHLKGVPVQSLAGDMAFYVGNDATSRVLVAFNEVPTPGTAMEGKIDVNPGSMVDIDGVVRSPSDPHPPSTTFTVPADATAYVFANNVKVLK